MKQAKRLSSGGYMSIKFRSGYMKEDRDPLFLWDVDGVLIDFNRDDPNRDWRKPLLERGYLESWEAFQKSSFWTQCLVDGKLNVRDAYCQYLSASNTNYQPDMPDEVISIWLNYNTAINDKALSALKSIYRQGYQCALATNQDGLRALWLRQWVIDNQLDNLELFISSEMGVAKPDKAFFQKIEERHPLKDAADYVYFDDNAEHIQESKKLGWSSYWVNEKFDWDGEVT